MLEWVQDLGGPQVATALLWAVAALALLVLVLVVIRLVRSLTFGTFVAGGRNRKTRLAVMDATAVDSHRRLVLIRRDDIEHLLLIGGPTDVVVERDIRLAQSRRPALTAHASPEALPHPRPRLTDPAPAGPRHPDPAPVPARRPPAPVPAPARPAGPAPAAPPARRQSPPPAMRSPEGPQPQPVAAARPAGEIVPLSAPSARPAGDVILPAPPQHRAPPADIPAAPPPYASNGAGAIAMKHSSPPPARQDSSLDETLLRELEVTFEPNTTRMPIKPPELTLDEEMTKLLGELSSHKRS
jgi:hypothetical protein